MSAPNDELEALKKSLAELLEYVQWYQDEGPPGEGWKSPELRAAIARAEKLLGIEGS